MLVTDLQRLIPRLEADSSLSNTRCLRKRIEVLDELDAYLEDGDCQALLADPNRDPIFDRARVIQNRLESVNSVIYQSIREQVRRGEEPRRLKRWIRICGSEAVTPAPGLGYDHLDELITGVLELQEPREADIQPGPDMVCYQPTPGRHILDLIKIAALSKADVLVDLGSGLGHVPILTCILTGSRCVGIELEKAYIESARGCAEGLRLSRVEFLQQDVREANLSAGTLFYLYTPFTGALLRTILGRLGRESKERSIRVCTLGPCASVVAREPWLMASGIPDADRITCFSSKTEG